MCGGRTTSCESCLAHCSCCSSTTSMPRTTRSSTTWRTYPTVPVPTIYMHDNHAVAVTEHRAKTQDTLEELCARYIVQHNIDWEALDLPPSLVCGRLLMHTLVTCPRSGFCTASTTALSAEYPSSSATRSMSSLTWSFPTTACRSSFASAMASTPCMPRGCACVPCPDDGVAATQSTASPRRPSAMSSDSRPC